MVIFRFEDLRIWMISPWKSEVFRPFRHRNARLFIGWKHGPWQGLIQQYGFYGQYRHLIIIYHNNMTINNISIIINQDSIFYGLIQHRTSTRHQQESRTGIRWDPAWCWSRTPQGGAPVGMLGFTCFSHFTTVYGR